MKKIFKLLPTFLYAAVALSLVLSCFAPRVDLVSVKAHIFSVQVYNDQPFVDYYLDIIEFTDGIVNSFRIAQSLAQGVSPKEEKNTRSTADEQNRSMDWVTTSNQFANTTKNFLYSVTGIANSVISAQVLTQTSTSFLHNLFMGPGGGGGGSPNYPSSSMPIWFLCFAILFALLPRGNLDINSIIINLNRANAGPAKEYRLGFSFAKEPCHDVY